MITKVQHAPAASSEDFGAKPTASFRIKKKKNKIGIFRQPIIKKAEKPTPPLYTFTQESVDSFESIVESGQKSSKISKNTAKRVTKGLPQGFAFFVENVFQSVPYNAKELIPIKRRLYLRSSNTGKTHPLAEETFKKSKSGEHIFTDKPIFEALSSFSRKKFIKIAESLGYSKGYFKTKNCFRTNFKKPAKPIQATPVETKAVQAHSQTSNHSIFHVIMGKSETSKTHAPWAIAAALYA